MTFWDKLVQKRKWKQITAVTLIVCLVGSIVLSNQISGVFATSSKEKNFYATPSDAEAGDDIYDSRWDKKIEKASSSNAEDGEDDMDASPSNASVSNASPSNALEYDYLTLEDDSEPVSVSGKLPIGTKLIAEPVSEEKLQKNGLEELELQAGRTAFAYDITLWLNGREYQPEYVLTVRIENSELLAGDLEVVQMELEKEDVAQTVSFSMDKEGVVTFSMKKLACFAGIDVSKPIHTISDVQFDIAKGDIIFYADGTYTGQNSDGSVIRGTHDELNRYEIIQTNPETATNHTIAMETANLKTAGKEVGNQGFTYDITLSGVNIDCSSYPNCPADSQNKNRYYLDIAEQQSHYSDQSLRVPFLAGDDTVSVNLTVEGENTLTGQPGANAVLQYAYYPQEQAESGDGALTIQGAGSITLKKTVGQSVNSGATIGGPMLYSTSIEGRTSNGTLIFDGATVEASTYAGTYAAAIGGGSCSPVLKPIIIQSGTVTATSAHSSAAIGAGGGSTGIGASAELIQITGGTVKTYSLGSGVGIGAGSSDQQSGGVANAIEISGESTVEVYKIDANEIQSFGMIGGGTSRTGQETKYDKSGGAATVNVSGHAVIRAESIGGGSATDEGANGGSANITISGNADIELTGSIGGGTSVSGTGGNATVTVQGGNLKCDSIGGGFSKRGTGGNAAVEVSGGVLDCRSIGGGNSTTGTPGAVDASEGNAGVRIRGGEVKTGTIGGGMNEEGAIGFATIDITGGQIQGQFILANTDTDKKCTFTMTGGTIDNTDLGTGNYQKAQENGGAVYLTDTNGVVNISGTAKICNSSAKNGGAIYMTGGNVILNGGSMIDNKAQENGGAVYMADGDVSIISGAVNQNIAERGAGGGVYINAKKDVNFHMFGGSLSNNTAKNSGGGLAAESQEAAQVKVVIGLCELHAFTEDGGLNPISFTHKSESYKHTNCPAVQANTADGEGGAFYLNSSGSVVEIYCLKEMDNTAKSSKQSSALKMNGGTLKIGDSAYTSETKDGAKGNTHMEGTILVQGGKALVYGSMKNPYFQNQITVDVKKAEDGYEDNRVKDQQEYRIRYYENFTEVGSSQVTGVYKAVQCQTGEQIIIESATFVHAGWSIKRWSTDPSGGEAGITYGVGDKVTPSTLKAKDGLNEEDNSLTLYAIWELCRHEAGTLTSVQAKFSAGQKFSDFENSASVMVNRDGAFTGQFDVTNLSGDEYQSPCLTFGQVIPTNVKFIMQTEMQSGDGTSSMGYWYYITESEMNSGDELPLTSFKKMGTGGAYTFSAAAAMQYRFIVDFSDVEQTSSQSKSGDWKMTLQFEKKEPETSIPDVSATGTVSLSEISTFEMQQQTESGNPVLIITKAETENEDADWSGQALGLLLQVPSGISVTSDLQLKVQFADTAGSENSKKIIWCIINADRQFVVPLGSIQENEWPLKLELELVSDVYCINKESFKDLSAQLYLSDTMEETSVLQGKKMAEVTGLTFQKEATSQPSVRVGTEKHIYEKGSDMNMVITYSSDIGSDAQYDIEAAIWKKQSGRNGLEDEYVDTAFHQSLAPSGNTNTFSLNAYDAGSYCLMITVSKTEGKSIRTIMEVPYYFIIMDESLGNAS